MTVTTIPLIMKRATQYYVLKRCYSTEVSVDINIEDLINNTNLPISESKTLLKKPQNEIIVILLEKPFNSQEQLPLLLNVYKKLYTEKFFNLTEPFKANVTILYLNPKKQKKYVSLQAKEALMRFATSVYSLQQMGLSDINPYKFDEYSKLKSLMGLLSSRVSQMINERYNFSDSEITTPSVIQEKVEAVIKRVNNSIPLKVSSDINVKVLLKPINKVNETIIQKSNITYVNITEDFFLDNIRGVKNKKRIKKNLPEDLEKELTSQV